MAELLASMREVMSMYLVPSPDSAPAGMVEGTVDE
jgi:hypothetical protein